MQHRVTYSRNLTLSLSRTCASYCKYCAFATHQAHLREPAEVLQLIDRAARQGAKELLILTGERPDHNAQVGARLQELGYRDFLSYVIWACEQGLEHGLLPHTNLGALGKAELARLREVTASQGMMLESVSERLMAGAHAGSPTKHPAVRLATIAAAGELQIPFTTGLLVGIGESLQERLATLEAIARMHERYGHIQEVIIQNFIPHRRYYGADVGQLAELATEAFWSTGIAPRHAQIPLPGWARGAGASSEPLAVGLEEVRSLVASARELMPDVPVQIPPNLAQWWPELIDSGASDLGGLSANGDHVSPEHPFPSPLQVRRRLAAEGIAVAERLCVHPRYISPEWLAPAVLDVIKGRFWTFIPRGRLERQQPPFAITDTLFARAIERAGGEQRLSLEELSALFAERREQAVEEIREAADALRCRLVGDLVTFVINRNINVSNICTVGCAFCGFGQGRRSPDAYEHDEAELQRRVREAIDYGASEICMQSGIHPDWELESYARWLEIARDTAFREGADLHLHAYSPMEVAHICDVSNLPPAEVFARLIDAGLGSTPGTAAEILDDSVRARISPNKLPAARWLEIIEAAHRAGLPSTATVMFGHIEEPWELARHMLLIRELQERTGGITEFVPLSFIPYQTLLGRTHGIEEITTAENLRHTAVFRLALGPSVRNLQASWVKMGLEAASESLRWGVNDLGGTLMEESISRMAGSHHGVRREPAELIGAAHAVGRPAAERSTLYAIRRTYEPEGSREQGARLAESARV
jgi:FO synthase